MSSAYLDDTDFDSLAEDAIDTDDALLASLVEDARSGCTTAYAELCALLDD